VLAESFNFLMNFGARGVGGATSTGFTSIFGGGCGGLGSSVLIMVDGLMLGGGAGAGAGVVITGLSGSIVRGGAKSDDGIGAGSLDGITALLGVLDSLNIFDAI
jgi:hypothetical protein